MKFHKIITVLGVSSLLTVMILIGVPPAQATDQCARFRIDRPTTYQVQTEEEARDVLNQSYISAEWVEGDTWELCAVTEAEVNEWLDAESTYSVMRIRVTAADSDGTADEPNSCEPEDAVCEEDPCKTMLHFFAPPEGGSVSWHTEGYDENGDPICSAHVFDPSEY